MLRKMVVTRRQQSTASSRVEPALESQLCLPGINDIISLSLASSFLIYKMGIILKAEDYCEG